MGSGIRCRVATSNGKQDRRLGPTSFIIGRVRHFVSACSRPNVDVARVGQVVSNTFRYTGQILLTCGGTGKRLCAGDIFTAISLATVARGGRFIVTRIKSNQVCLIHGRGMRRLDGSRARTRQLYSLNGVAERRVCRRPSESLLASTLNFRGPRVSLEANGIRVRSVMVLLASNTRGIVGNRRLRTVVFRYNGYFSAYGNVVGITGTLKNPSGVSIYISCLEG